MKSKNRKNVRTIRRQLRVESLERRMVLTANPMITEFMASNRDSLLDGSSPPASPDWIEIYNAGREDMNLNGWFLTDDPEQLTKWQFPDALLAVDEYKVIFASGDGTPDLKGQLHTNFRLAAGGEYVALVHPNGQTIASEFGAANSEYPRQIADVSYGTIMQPTTKGLVTEQALARILVPAAPINDDWKTAGFDDNPLTTSWHEASTAIGFGETHPLNAIVDTDVKHLMQGNNASVLVRIPFEIDDISIADSLALKIAYNDGFVASLNGQSIASANAPTNLSFDSAATSTHNALGEVFELNPSARAIFYDFENDADQSVTDKLVDDGQQDAIFNNQGMVDTGVANAAFGVQSLQLPDSTRPSRLFNRLQLPETANLGQEFTLAVHAKIDVGRQRLFSNFEGLGSIDAERIVFEVDRDGGIVDGVRLSIGGRGTVEPDTVPSSLSSPGYHHFAATYVDGNVSLYVDGELVASKVLGKGPLVMPLDLFFGEDPHDAGGSRQEQFVGNADDILVLSGIALSPNDIRLLANEGATALLDSGGREPQFEVFDVTAHRSALQNGENVLAIQGLNVSPDDEDFYLLPQLFATQDPEGRPPAYFPKSTPGAINQDPRLGLVSDTRFSVDRGFYDEPIEVEVAVDTPGATIIYTLDGSEPTIENGIQFPAPTKDTTPSALIQVSTTTTLRATAVKPDFHPTNVDTHSYVFLDDVIRQPAAPEGFPERWGRTRADYEMDPEIVDAVPYREIIRDSLLSLPTFSLTLENEDFFGADGIYSNTIQRGDEWERPVSVEYLDPATDSRFQVDAGLRVHGGYSRDPGASPQHSLRLHFRSQYGTGKLDFPMFPDSDVTQYDALVLNAQSSDNWTSINTITGRVAQFMRDQWAQDMQRELGQPYVPGRFAHVYINGLYWGMYGLMERIDDDFAANHFGGDNREYDVIVDEVAFRGEIDAWQQLLTSVREGDYDGTKQLLDVDNFIDYVIINMYMGNWDWPDHNWHAYRRRAEGETFKFLVWDAEVGLGLDVNIPGPIRPGVLDVDLTGQRADLGASEVANGPGEIYDALRQIPEFQLQFADRLHKHLFNQGVFTTDRVASVYAARASEIELPLVSQSARWGDVRRHPPDVPEGVWSSERDWILNTFFAQRGEILLKDFQDESLYPTLAAPVFNQHGGDIGAGFHLKITNVNEVGTVWMTLDGSDPRMPGGAISATAITYKGPISLGTSQPIRARIVDAEGQWSALNAADFTVVEGASGDFDLSGNLNEPDLIQLCGGFESQDSQFDLNNDQRVDLGDLLVWIEDLFGSSIGDANLDGLFDAEDLVATLIAGEYDDQIVGNSTWSEGDWNCDGEFDSEDLVTAFVNGGYVSTAARPHTKNQQMDWAAAVAMPSVPLARTEVDFDRRTIPRPAVHTPTAPPFTSAINDNPTSASKSAPISNSAAKDKCLGESAFCEQLMEGFTEQQMPSVDRIYRIIRPALD